MNGEVMSAPSLRASRATPPGQQRRLILVLAGIAALFLAWSWQIANGFCSRIDGRTVCSLADDAMISMRYARMAAEGHGLVWNVGERVEGYTNPLWTLLMTGLHFVAPPTMVVRIMQAIGALAALGVILAGARTSAQVAGLEGPGPPRHELPLTILGALTLFLCYPVHHWSLAGMEVGALCLCAVLAFRSFVRCWAGLLDQDRAAAWCVALSLAAYLLRPDGFIALAVPTAGTLALAMARWRDRSGPAPRLAGVALAAAVVTAALHLFARRLYYGQWVPNTYVLKMQGFDLGQRIENGLRFVALFLSEHALLLLAVVAIAVVVRRTTALYAAGLLQMACLCAYQAYVGGDPWPSWRQMAPGLAVNSLLLASGVGAVVLHGSRIAARKDLVAAALLLLAVSGVLQSNRRFAGEMLLRGRSLMAVGVERNTHVGLRLREVLDRRALVNVFWAGTLAYFWHGPAADTLGKTDPRISNLPAGDLPAWSGMAGVPGHNKYDLGYSLRTQAPDFIEGWVWGHDDYTAYVAHNFVEVGYKEVVLCLRRGSPRVRWDLVSVRGSCIHG